MLTTISAKGIPHARAMAPTSSKGNVYTFIGNKESGKYDDIKHNSIVNVSFSDGSTTHWASVAGHATIITFSDDAEKVKEMYSPDVKAVSSPSFRLTARRLIYELLQWLGDLGDGKHTGKYDDPRVALIEVVPFEIRYWYQNKGSIGQAYEVIKGTVTGDVAAPGVLRVISKGELEIARKVDGVNVA